MRLAQEVEVQWDRRLRDGCVDGRCWRKGGRGRTRVQHKALTKAKGASRWALVHATPILLRSAR